MRERVWALLLSGGTTQSRATTTVLELNCGTGADAVWMAKQGWRVLATDVSPEMVAVTREKARQAGVGALVHTQVCSFAEIGNIDGTFDLVFSNFGGLNCIPPAALKSLGEVLPGKLKPGGMFVAVVMSRFCWWETLYYLLKMNPKTAFRRLSRNPVNAHLDEKTTVPTWYYSPAEFRRFFCTTDFQVRRRSQTHRRTWKSVVQRPAGFWLPPSYLNPFFEKHPRLLRLLNFLEQHCAPAWLAPCADHFFISLEKSSDE